tara:strand:+ start:389 stop:1567 length:1179 start_codon:yes stop_codon:yes gene_type:complete
MFINLFHSLKNLGVPVSMKEYLDLLSGLNKGVCSKNNTTEFYNFAKMALIKDEKYFDRFDIAFSNFYVDNQKFFINENDRLPKSWLEDKLKKIFSEKMKNKIFNNKDFDKILEEFKKKIEEQKKRHQGGNKWIGTGGTSMYGNSGYNPRGIRVGGVSKNRSAIKVWEKRDFENLDHDADINNRNIGIALRRLRKLAREGTADELDIDDTIKITAKNAGLLEIKLRPQRINKVRILILFDVGGSMDDHTRKTEELFSAARSEFKSLDYFYFHNCIYEKLWKDNRRRHTNYLLTEELIRTYNKNTKLIVVGDALMSPYEISYPGGSIEHWNDKPGSYWVKKIIQHFNKCIWLNPENINNWNYSESTKILKSLFEDKMYQMNIKGIENGMRELSK